jgi:hypothetical protein
VLMKSTDFKNDIPFYWNTLCSSKREYQSVIFFTP